MHLWPSLRIRDSFKFAYIEKLEANLARMKQSKKNQQQNGADKAPLIETGSASTSKDGEAESNGVIDCALDLLVLLSCCCCCFCCGACADDDEYHPSLR